MTKKQHLEGLLSKTLQVMEKNDNIVWYLKLQIMPLAHKPNPADYIVLSHYRAILIECKETTSNTFVFSRLTQLNDMLYFSSKGNKFKSYLLMCFWDGKYNNSLYYYIPIEIFQMEMTKTNKKSFNKNDFERLFGQYILTYDKEYKILDMRDLFKY